MLFELSDDNWINLKKITMAHKTDIGWYVYCGHEDHYLLITDEDFIKIRDALSQPYLPGNCL